MRKGRLAKSEIRYITANAETMTVEDIARALDRDPESIDQFVKTKLKVGLPLEDAAIFSIRERPYWRELSLQFTKDELDLLEYHWGNIIAQFKDNVIHTEELQILDLIKLELLMNRSLKLSKSSNDQIFEMEERVRIERALPEDIRNREEIINFERQIASLKAAQESMTRDYRELQSKKNSMLKEMRATREQRIKDIEESKETFVGWIKYLIANPEVARGYGVEMEKMRLAMEKEKIRLGAYHKYEDGMIDRPFLTPESVMQE